ncbi:7913_t:CDS:2 [Acaulospora morrowiae]|uniref:7913_t:CDS:1 n=1 Tax=Acaulospora morrowiae TaxID=94023 RepID=A0A9N8VMP6_9GLOM|nr:7913_t:CDS:2 [Acaulospora morrowiae]
MINSSSLPTPLENHYILLRHGRSKANVAGVVVSTLENGCPPASPAESSSGPHGENNGWGLTSVGEEQVKRAAQDVLEYLLTAHNLNPSRTARVSEVRDMPGDPEGIVKSQKPIRLAIYTSPFLRTLETAAIVHDHISNYLGGSEDDLGFPSAPRRIILYPSVITVQGLRERNFGIYELKPDHESYNKVWKLDGEVDSKSNGHDNDEILDKYREIGVETCEQVQSRMCGVIKEIELDLGHRMRIEDVQEAENVAILVSHGDSLQILQTAFEDVKPTAHRKLNHLGTAEWRIF